MAATDDDDDDDETDDDARARDIYAIMTTKATVEVASSLSDGAILQYWTPGGSSDRSIRRPWKRGTMNQRHDQL